MLKTDASFMKQVIDRIPGMVVVYNMQSGDYIYVNDSIRQLLGYSPDAIIYGGYRFVTSLIHPDDLPVLMADNKKALEKANKSTSKSNTDPIVTFEYRMKHKNGSWRWLHTDGIVFDRDNKGKVLHIMNISIDITERRERELSTANSRKQFEQQLQQSERRYRSLIENSYEAVTISNKEGIITYATPSIKRILGFKPEEVIGRSITNFFPVEDRKTEMKKLKDVLRVSKKSIKLQTKYVHKNGKTLLIESTVANLLDDPFVQGLVSNFRDITEQMLIAEKKHHLAAIVSSSDDAIISKTLGGVITSWNKAAQKIYGYTPKEAIGKHISLIIPKELLSEEDNILKTLSQGKRIEHFETTRQTKSGRKIFVSLSISPIYNESGEIIGASKIARDITDQKKFEEAVMQSKERLQLAIDAGRIGIWDWDIVRNDIVWSKRVYEIHGIRQGTKIGELEKYRSRHHPEDAERVKQAINDALLGKKQYQEEFRIITPAGKIKWVETRAVVIRDRSGKPIRMLGATLDITERKTLEEQKDAFIGIASHELKTPVTSIKVYTQLLEGRFHKEGNENAAKLLSKVNTQLDKLTVLINDLLDVTKIQTGKLEFHEEYFNMNDLVNEIVDEVQATTQKHTLVMKLNSTTMVYGDRYRTGQVLTNFLTNAVKYTPQAGKIYIRTLSDSDTITVSVKDSGIGIPKDIQEKVFDRFYRVSIPSGQTFPGMGLGLYISSQIIKRQNGTISVESSPGKGSTFSFSLPLNRKAKHVTS